MSLLQFVFKILHIILVAKIRIGLKTVSPSERCAAIIKRGGKVTCCNTTVSNGSHGARPADRLLMNILALAQDARAQIGAGG